MVVWVRQRFTAARRDHNGSVYSPRGASHGRVGVATAERVQAVSGAGDVEVKREVLVDGEHVPQMPLQRIAGIEALRAIAGPQRLHRLARLVDRESGMRAEAQSGVEIQHLIALCGVLERDRRLAQEATRRIDQAARASDLD